MARQRRADRTPRTEDEVHDSRRGPGLLEQPHQVDRRQRGDLAGFEHDGVPRDERGRHLPGDLQQRVVPRGDERADADGVVHDAADDLGATHVDGPVDLDDPFPGVVPEHGGDVVDVDAGLGERLARVERLRPGDLLAVALEQVGDAVQEGGPFGDRRPRPGPSSNAVRAARTAASASCAAASSTTSNTCPSKGFTTSRVPPAAAERHSPATNSSGTWTPDGLRRTRGPGEELVCQCVRQRRTVVPAGQGLGRRG